MAFHSTTLVAIRMSHGVCSSALPEEYSEDKEPKEVATSNISKKRIRPKCSITSGGRGTLLVVVTCLISDIPDIRPFTLE
jgi:hypothetical protein